MHNITQHKSNFIDTQEKLIKPKINKTFMILFFHIESNQAGQNFKRKVLDPIEFSVFLRCQN